MKRVLFTGLILISIIFNSLSQQLAFPGAEGYGKYTKGGRGGAVYEVTNLNNSGAGSLGAAISASGPRTVVFKVAGTIEGDFTIENDNITIAGQTAPGDGICIKGTLLNSASNVIIRYIRVRANPVDKADALWGRYEKNIIVDHVSTSWSGDEVLSIYHNENVTIQWCMITEPCEKEGEGHRFGGIWGNPYGTYHHNLIAHSDSRNPRWASGCGYNDYRNNVLYNWGYNSCYGAEAQQSGKPEFNFSTINMIANYYKPGPATSSGVRSRIAEPSTRNGETDAGKWWLSNNVVEGYPVVTEDNWRGFARSEPFFRLIEPWDAMPINQHSPEDAYLEVLGHAGCSKPNRDTIDKRIINEVRTGTTIYGTNGIIDYPTDVGGWPFLAAGTAYTDTDHDGMPNDWEITHGLDTNDAADRNYIGEGGYTNLEVFLYSLLGDGGSVTGVSISPTTDTVYIGVPKCIFASVEPTNPFNKNISWSSSDTSVVTVDATGLLTGIKEGSAIVTVTTEDGGFTAISTVTVSHALVTAIDVSPTTWHLYINDTRQLYATVYPDHAFNKNISWSSSDTTVATVDSTGLVTGVAAGSAVITVTTEDGGLTATSEFTILDPSSLAKKESEKDIRIYPVPFNDRLNIQFGREFNEPVDIFLLDVTGKTIRHEKAAGRNHLFELSDVKEGIYNIRVIGSIINVSETIIKLNNP